MSASLAASLTAQLATLIEQKPISENDLRHAAFFVLDAVANAVAGQNSPAGKILRSWWHENQSGNALLADVGKQAFLMGALTHILETDDLHRASVVHPGCVVVPAAWALARRKGTDGRAFLISVLKGFEATTRVGMAVGPAHYRIWHNTATCGGFGSAMAACDLLGLSHAQTIDALGNAGSQAAGLWQFLETGAMTKHMHAGRAAEAGVRAAELAAVGFTGAPYILEGEKGFFKAACPDAQPELVVADPDQPWQLVQTSIKPWPSCRHTHPSIDAAGEIRAQLLAEGINPAEQIASVSLGTYQAALDVCTRPDPQTDYEAKFSLHHTAAAALLSDSVDFNAFGPEARTSFRALRSTVSVALQEPYATAYPKSWGGSVSVTLKDGRTLTATRTHAKGDPEAALSEENLIEKAEMLFAHAAQDTSLSLPTGLTQEIISLVTSDKPLPDLQLGR